MEKWVLLRKGADFQKIGKQFHIQPRIASLIRNRDIIGEKAIDTYLHGTIADLHDGMWMKDMDKAVEILSEKIREGQKIRVIGDYDIDGIHSTYILLEGIRLLGGNVDIDIPDRMKDGYGLNKHLIESAFDADVDTIVTCDNGIAAREEIAYGKEMGMTIIVTDHHEVPYEEAEGEKKYLLPPADAVVDPKQVDCTYPFDGLCGAGVAYKLVEALYNVMGRDVEDVDYLMENVAIATVGDVMDLVDENRIFVKQGLEMLKQTKNLGMKALMECTKVPVDRLSAYHIGFVLGPCMNASGRLDTAKRALELLCANTKKEADILAGDLKALNDSRKDMTEVAVKQAITQVEETAIGEDHVVVVYLPDCHESLAGIVAGRLRERYHKPTYVLTKGTEGVKGSGRSIEAYSMYEELHKCRQLLTKFGGHKLAAGLSLDETKVAEFRKKINEVSTLTAEDLVEKVSIDMQLPFSEVNEEFIRELALLEPFGKGNTKPVFVEKNIEILNYKILGKRENVLKLRVQDGSGVQLDALYFGDIPLFLSQIEQNPHEKRAFVYYPGVNEYMGRKTLQITIGNYQ
ncbi:MAG: single-stranded-DNA-specific exonuclease RecJ [Lachnospiraceae bacterium]